MSYIFQENGCNILKHSQGKRNLAIFHSTLLFCSFVCVVLLSRYSHIAALQRLSPQQASQKSEALPRTPPNRKKLTRISDLETSNASNTGLGDILINYLYDVNIHKDKLSLCDRLYRQPTEYRAYREFPLEMNRSVCCFYPHECINGGSVKGSVMLHASTNVMNIRPKQYKDKTPETKAKQIRIRIAPPPASWRPHTFEQSWCRVLLSLNLLTLNIIFRA